MLTELLRQTQQAAQDAADTQLRKAAAEARSHRLRQLRRGRDATGQAMRPYAARYARRRKGGRRSPVTLRHRKGRIPGGLRVVRKGRRRYAVRLVGSQASRLGRFHQKDRKWFSKQGRALSRRKEREMRRRFGAGLSARLPRDRRRRFEIRLVL